MNIHISKQLNWAQKEKIIHTLAMLVSRDKACDAIE